ncbi:dihydrofolate reductase family protein [Leifsonia sp. 22587]|uniref:dihydrofolate reductase family protein n=1 Tax=Leifsonia sp. 22587 TaxID=3453946 RepID=UPI003F8766BC
MGRLLYSAIASVDGYTVDAAGSFAWAAPDAEVHAFANALEWGVGTVLYGRRMYETMRVWQDMPGAEDDPVTAEFAAAWRDSDKIVFSSSLAGVTTPRTRLERTFDPDAVRTLVQDAEHDVSIGGPTLAARAFAAGLVAEVWLMLVPVAVGGGTPALPLGQRLGLELRDERRFGNGTVALHYAVQN